jgi:hypothetical protein
MPALKVTARASRPVRFMVFISVILSAVDHWPPQGNPRQLGRCSEKAEKFLSEWQSCQTRRRSPPAGANWRGIPLPPARRSAPAADDLSARRCRNDDSAPVRVPCAAAAGPRALPLWTRRAEAPRVSRQTTGIDEPQSYRRRSPTRSLTPREVWPSSADALQARPNRLPRATVSRRSRRAQSRCEAPRADSRTQAPPTGAQMWQTLRQGTETG